MTWQPRNRATIGVASQRLIPSCRTWTRRVSSPTYSSLNLQPRKYINIYTPILCSVTFFDLSLSRRNVSLIYIYIEQESQNRKPCARAKISCIRIYLLFFVFDKTSVELECSFARSESTALARERELYNARRIYIHWNYISTWERFLSLII